MGQQGNGIKKRNLKLDVLSLAPQILLKLTNLESKEIGWLKHSERRIIVNVFVLENKPWYITSLFIKVSNGAKIRNRYNQVPHLTQDTNGKVTNSQKTPQTRAKRSALSQQHFFLQLQMLRIYQTIGCAVLKSAYGIARKRYKTLTVITVRTQLK